MCGLAVTRLQVLFLRGPNSHQYSWHRFPRPPSPYAFDDFLFQSSRRGLFLLLELLMEKQLSKVFTCL